MNKQIAIGNLAQAATVTTHGERDMLAFTVACNDGEDKDGKPYVEFIPAVVWGKKGYFANILPHLPVGQLVSVTGKLQHTKPNEKDGTVYQNVLIEVAGLRKLRLLGKSKGSQPADQPDQGPTPSDDVARQNQDAIEAAGKNGPSPDFDNFDDDIPF